MPKPTGPQVFREWLLKQLVGLRWTEAGNDAVKLSEELGVREDLLVDAMVLRAEMAKGQGREFRYGVKARGDLIEMRLKSPDKIYALWKEAAKRVHIDGGVLLRGSIHYCLTHHQKPTRLSPHWIFAGERLTTNRDNIRANWIKSFIPRGAKTALGLLAAEWGATDKMVMRGLVLDIIEGRATRIPLVAASQLWNDPDRYLHPEKFRR